VYISENALTRLKLFTALNNTTQLAALDTLIYNILDEHGHLRPESIKIDKPTLTLLNSLALEYNKSISEMVSWMCETISIYFSDDLPLWLALQPTSVLVRKIEELENMKKIQREYGVSKHRNEE